MPWDPFLAGIVQVSFHLWPRGGAHAPPLTFHPGGKLSAKRHFFVLWSAALVSLPQRILICCLRTWPSEVSKSEIKGP